MTTSAITPAPTTPAQTPDVQTPETSTGSRKGDALRASRTTELVAELATCSDPVRTSVLTDELIRVNMQVAETIASRYHSRGIPFEDLQQVGYLALTKAAHRFDPRAGHDFMSFCVPTIRGEIRRHFRDHGWTVRPPRPLQELQARLNRVQDELTSTLGRDPTVAELADSLEESPEDIRRAMERRGCFTPESLDRRVGEGDGVAIGELIGIEDSECASVEARVALAPAVRRLSERDRMILRLRFFEGKTQREIAESIGVTQMQVSRLLSRIFKDLRAELGEADTSAA